MSTTTTRIATAIILVLFGGVVLSLLWTKKSETSFPLSWKTDNSQDTSSRATAIEIVINAIKDSNEKQQQSNTNSKPIIVTHRPGFPSYKKQSHVVTYDKRSFRINGERAFFLSGSLHPARATHATWNRALDDAVRHGLNMITIYVMWAAHQPFPDNHLDWSLPGCVDRGTECGWTLATAIREAANRGLFVHVRIGPYVCAEYNYGGIPEWVGLEYPEMEMRRPNRDWMNVMKAYVEETVEYLAANNLFAYQGGPILMAQIENELGGEELDAPTPLETVGAPIDDPFALSQSRKLAPRTATMQDYADWCGDMAERVEPNVIWTMCFGLSANNTIDTCNGVSCAGWLENHGDSGRIQIDQPPLWTEDEGGFQVWGDDPHHPSDYFSGINARTMAVQALKWFARGGTHLNYYMWWGSYNRGRAAAAGIANMYANDANICSSGEHHQPKFDHLTALHNVMAGVANVLLHAPTALDKSQHIECYDQNGQRITGDKQRMFLYQAEEIEHDPREVAFVENDEKELVIARIQLPGRSSAITVELQPESAILLVDGVILFDSATLHPQSMSYERKIIVADSLLDMSSWEEPIGVSFDKNDPRTVVGSKPKEQTALNVEARMNSDFAWYETDFVVTSATDNATIYIDTQEANAMYVFLEQRPVGFADHHKHAEGDATLSINVGELAMGHYVLSILSESFGYSNLIGRWGGSTKAKTKGITGDVQLVAHASDNSGLMTWNQSLVDGREWRSYPGLHGEALGGRSNSVTRADLMKLLKPGSSRQCSWTSALFDTPRYDPNVQALFVDVTSGRGHLFLNGFDLGTRMNITRGDTDVYSQRYYFLPQDYLYSDGSLNELVLFDAEGADHTSTRLVLSWIQTSDNNSFEDEIAFPGACMW